MDAPPSKAKIFLSRLGSAVFLYGMLLVGLFAHNEKIAHAAFGSIMLLFAALALFELFQMARKCGLACFQHFGITAGTVLVGGVFWALSMEKQPDLASQIEFGIIILLIPCLGINQLLRAREKLESSAMAVTLFGILYVGVMLNLMQKIRFGPETGAWWLLFFIVVSKMSDTGAYCVGSLVGRHKMMPRVSPGKTWEGFAGALVFSMCAAVAFSHFGADHFKPMSLFAAATLGLALGLGSVAGDLVESLFKREAGVKDSGSYFPGIGGFLDLLDSLLFNAPLMYLYLRYGLDVL